MTKSRKVVFLWCAAGSASIAAGLLAEPRRPFAITAGVLFLLVAITALYRHRRERW